MPLNPELHEKLERHLGEVRIANEGQAMACRYGYRATDRQQGPKKLIVLENGSGEMYHVCCPFCHDTRFRLYINHRWGVRDRYGRRNLWLAKCHNEDCLAKPGRVTLLDEKVRGMGINRRKRGTERILPGKPADTGVAGEVPSPGEVVSLHDLPPEHPARQYLLDRGFDPDKLAELFGAQFCEQSRSFPLAAGRIIIPVWEDGKLVGWQARRPDDKPAAPGPYPDPKYYSCPGMARRKILYNWKQASQHSVLVVCEGPTDVWSFGPEAVAIFGKDASTPQRRQIVEIGANKPVAIMLDPDPDPKAKIHHIEKLYNQLKPAIRRLFKVYLPEGTDPGDLDRSFMVARIKEAARQQGVSFRRKVRVK